MRRRGLLWAAVLLAVVPGCGRETVKNASVARPAVGEKTAAVTQPPAPSFRTVAAEVRDGEPLDSVLRRLELDGNERHRVVQALDTEIDLRRILPGEEVEVSRDSEGRVREVTLRRDVLESVVAAFEPDEEPRVRTVSRNPDLSVRSVRGTLDGSLYESLLAAGADANLVMRFADLLAWQVDFLTEPRSGDELRILVQYETLDGEGLGFGKILAAEYRGDRATARAIRYRDSAGDLDWYDDEGRSVRRAFLKSPLHYSRISSGFTARRRHPVLKRVMPHWGVDYAAAQGTPVSALGAGVIDFVGRNGGFGNYIEVRHSSTYTTCYGHLWKFAGGIRRGVRVEQGQVIGYVGSTGIATGPHLDFRVKKNGGFVNPLGIDSPPGRTIGAADRERFAVYHDRVWRLAERVAPGEDVPLAAAWERVPPGTTKEELLALAR